jgi:hypothetical protein
MKPKNALLLYSAVGVVFIAGIVLSWTGHMMGK